jgi:hypothetical protein
MTISEIVGLARIHQVWQALGGGKINRHHRSRAFWRNGDGWSVSIHEEKKCWFDHRDGIGGGILDLIQKILGNNREDAALWLADLYGLKLGDAAPQRDQEDRKRLAAEQRYIPASQIWRRERLAELDELKVQALDDLDYQLLEEAAGEDDLLRNHLNEIGIVRAYLASKAKWPTHTEKLLRQGRKWDRAASHAVLALVAQWAEDADQIDCWQNEGGAL